MSSRISKVRRFVWAVAATLGVVVVGLGAASLASPESRANDEDTLAQGFSTPDASSGAEEGRLIIVAATYEAEPRALTAAECAEARPRMEAQASLLAAQIARSGGGTELESRLAAAVAESRAWFDAGCPQDTRLGYYESKARDGSLKSVLIDW